MANEFVVVFSDVKSWFGKVFKNAPKATAAALSVLNTAAPLFEAVVAVTDPAMAVIIDPIVTVIQADLGTLSQLLATGNITSVGSFQPAIFSAKTRRGARLNSTTLAMISPSA